MAEEQVNVESRKKGIAITSILALAAMKPASKIELCVAGGIVAIAIAGIMVQGFLDWKK